MKTPGLLFTAAPLPFAAPKAAVVLVHGGFADGSRWARVIPILERDGYAVIAAPNPPTSSDDDVATMKRVIDAQKGLSHPKEVVTVIGAAAAESKGRAPIQ
ncbi:MAG TPA: hypothetical protein VHE81_21075 [Lacipirellulaceae bacterium]|jgi:pimeloyl-ACP methyl ester carboxylesterase|nr:hypothetical protein [Lacipirellulaceae bacterium]